MVGHPLRKRYVTDIPSLDLYDSVYELVDSLTFKLRAISPSMWKVFEITCELFKGEAIDYLEEMLPFLDNCVSFGTATIQARPDYKQSLIDIFTISITSEHLGANDAVNGCKLVECMLLNLRGNIDEALLPIISTIFAHIEDLNIASLRLAMLEVLVNVVLYNPAAALSLMGDQARAFFDRWFSAINKGKLPRVHDKKLSILTLAALMEMDPSQVPAGVQEGWPGLLGGALKLFKEYPEAVKARKALEEEQEEFEDDDGSVDERYLNLENDDGDVWDENSAYLEMLAQESSRLRDNATKLETALVADAGDEEEEEDDDPIEEELGFFTPLDQVDMNVTFKAALEALQARNPGVYQASTTALNVEQQTVLMEVMKLAENPKA